MTRILLFLDRLLPVAASCSSESISPVAGESSPVMAARCECEFQRFMDKNRTLHHIPPLHHPYITVTATSNTQWMVIASLRSQRRALRERWE